MPLEMRGACERCQAPLTHEELAFICSYERTYRAPCAIGQAQVCGNCGGELVRRPRRADRV